MNIANVQEKEEVKDSRVELYIRIRNPHLVPVQKTLLTDCYNLASENNPLQEYMFTMTEP